MVGNGSPSEADGVVTVYSVLKVKELRTLPLVMARLKSLALDVLIVRLQVSALLLGTEMWPKVTLLPTRLVAV